MDAFHTDHVIQGKIIDSLHCNGTQTFSELKPSDVENSLFMYHMRKLLARKIVEKSVDGFRLTPAGARWVNQTDEYQRIVHTPRLLVQLIVIKDDHVLISERVDHMAQHLNRYMLPGGIHRFGETTDACAERVARKFSLESTPTRVGQVEIIIGKKQHHSVVDIYSAPAPSLTYEFDDELFVVRFMPIADVLSMKQDEANVLPNIVRLIIEQKLDHVTFQL